FLRFIILLTDGNENLCKDDKFIHEEEDQNKLKNKLLESILGSIFVGISPLYIKRMDSYKKNNLWDCIFSFNNKELEKIYRDPEVSDGGELLKLVEFKDKVGSILKLANLSVYDFVLKFLNTERIGIIDFLLKNKTISESERESYLNILGDYLESLKDFSGNNPFNNSVRDYLLFLEDIEGNDFLEEIEESIREIVKQGYVNVISYHHCKGLEFEVVFMPFISKNYLPAAFGKTQLYDLQIFNYFSEGEILPGEEIRKKHMENERNLFYTGMTRAKSSLFITANRMEDNSIFFEEVKNIYRTLKSDAETKYKKQKKGKNIFRDNKAAGYLPEFYKLLYSYTGSRWLVRKTAAAKTIKLKKGLKINVKNYLRAVSFLKLFYPYDKWWGSRNFTKNSRDPFQSIKPVFSYTSLNTYLECPYRYKIRDYIGLKEEKSMGLIIGGAYHKIMKFFFKGGSSDFSWKRLLKIIDKVFEDIGFEFEYLKKVFHFRAISDFKKYFDNYFPSP
ncbi:MAG: ATP-dependent helicase, partial [Actinobacteria bacterium]|nr:ATP-dependent helicase [Actinomycetota bacterium]